MDLHQVRYFLALAETLNFTKAAERCGVTQPTMSRAVKLLEEEFGADLIRRERGRTHLTELGRIVRPGLERALEMMDSVQTDAVAFSRLTKATLRLGIMCTIGPSRLIPTISHLSLRAPQLTIELLEASGEKIVEMLVNGEIDVALVGMPDYPEAISVHPLYEETYVVVFPKGHRFADMETVPVTELSGEPYLERLNCEYVAHYNSVRGPFRIDVDVRYKSEHEDWIQAMILAGMGCACMPEFMMLFPELKRRELVDPTIRRTISVATVRGRRHTPAIDLFTRLCVELHRERR